MDSKMIISLGELTQILATTMIFSSQEDHILTAAKNSSTSPEVKEESDEDPEASIVKEIKYFGEQSCEPENDKAKEENIQCNLHGEGNQGYYDPIETWFKTIIRSHKSFVLPSLFISYHLYPLVSHTHEIFKVHFINVSVNMSMIVLRTSLNWKYVFT